MTSGTQTIDVDAQRKLVIVTLSGFFTPQVAHDATMELRAAIRSLGDAVGQHLTLYDCSAVTAAPAETVDLIRMGFANPVYRPLWARKVAFVTTSTLLRRQLDRIRESRPDMTIFDDRNAAIEWLLQP